MSSRNNSEVAPDEAFVLNISENTVQDDIETPSSAMETSENSDCETNDAQDITMNGDNFDENDNTEGYNPYRKIVVKSVL